MSLLKKQLKYLVASHGRYEIWKNKEESNLSGQTVIIEDTTSKNTLPEQILYLKSHLHVSKSVIAEFHQEVKKQTSKDKLLTWNENFLPTKLSKTSVPDLILNEKELKPFWNSRIQELSKKSWLPTKIDCVVSDSSCLNKFLNAKAMQKSWFSTTYLTPLKKSFQKTSYKFSQSLVPESTDLRNTKLISRKIKIYPNLIQRKTLKNYVGAYRKTYNLTVHHINTLPREEVYKECKDGSYIKLDDKYIFVGKGNGEYKLGSTMKPSYYIDDNGEQKKTNQTSLITMRPLIRDKLPEWSKNVPTHLFDRAISECSVNYKSLVEKVKATGKKCNLSYKSRRRSITETITLEAGMISKKKKNTLFPTTVGTVKTTEDFIQPKHECKLEYNRKTKEWFFILVKEFKQTDINHKNDICSIDPGEKAFLTVYSPDNSGHVVSIAENNRSSKMYQKLKRVDELISKKTKIKNKKKKNGLTRAIHRLYKKVKNLRDDLHKKSCNFLCKNYKNIVVPEYKSKSMLSNLNNNVCRSMSTLSFYMFRKRLEHKCLEYGCKLYIVGEEYTSMTCGNCGILNKPKDREYHCSNCNTTIHRDYNGARNILLKQL